MSCNIEHAKRFLEFLGGEDTAYLVAIHDQDKSKPVYNDIGLGEAEGLNAEGYGIFFCVNEVNGGRTKSCVTKIRAFIAEDDSDTVKTPLIPASLIVRSGRGNHYYFLAKPGVTIEQAEEINARLALAMGTDPRVKDASRVLRLPGFYHCKAEPVMVKAKKGKGGPYSYEEMDRWLPKLPQKPSITEINALNPSLIPKTDELEARARAYVRRLEPSVSGYGGHDALWRAAIVLCRGFCLPKATALEILQDEFNPRCEPPWSDWELTHKVEQAAASKTPYGYILAKERSPLVKDRHAEM